MPTPSSSASPSSLRFCLPPSLGKEAAEERAERLRQHLTAAVGRPVEVSVAPSYESLARNLLFGTTDAAWAPPFICARVESMGLRVLVRGIRRGASSYRAALICRAKDVLRASRLQRLSALWVDRDSVAGYLLPTAWLRSRGLTLSSQEFAGSYRAAIEGVLAGRADVTSIFAPAPAPGRSETTGVDEVLPGRGREAAVLAYTEESSNDGVAVAGHVSPELCRTLERTFSSLHGSLDGLGLLKSNFNVERFEPAPPRAYSALYRVALATR